MPFVISFTSYFIALYAMEALFLKRLFDDGAQATPRAVVGRESDAATARSKPRH